VERAEAARKRAEERIAAAPQSEIDYDRARAALTKALTRLQVGARVPAGARVGELKRIRDVRS
jgi:F-type H+-transporting ATPase subunit epsilon